MLQENQSPAYKAKMAVLCPGVIEQGLTMIQNSTRCGYRAQGGEALTSVQELPIKGI